MSEECPSCRLDDSVLSHLGQIVCARPIYGWGWAEGEKIEGKRTNFSCVEVPPVFHFNVERFFDWNGKRRGGVGQIRELGHPHDGKWLLYYTRVCGAFNFDPAIADYNLHIGTAKPDLHPVSWDSLMAQRWPLPHFPGRRSIWGFGLIGSTHEVIVSFEERRIREWKRDETTDGVIFQTVAISFYHHV
jgi:hypothetical protein